MSAYAPPSHPPPPGSAMASASSSSFSTYAPTNTPTPGQPLLRNGQMLVYPHGWRGCPKCQDTGYKHADPTHPCRKCWQTYGQAFNPILVSTAGMQGAKILQKPLPFRSSQGAGGTYNLTSNHRSGHAGFPGAMSYQPMPGSGGAPSTNPFASHMTGGNGSDNGGNNISGAGRYAPPSQPPPPRLPPRREPVRRTQESREDDINEQGEAPPAYEDAVAAGPDGALPPQRADENRQTSTTSSSQQQQQQFSPPSHAPPPQQQQQQQQQYHHHHPQHHNYAAGHPPVPPMQNSGYFHPPHQGPQVVPYGHIPPPNALVVRPGDPRLGGRLCYKCGGDGIREDFWFGMQETCRHCNGTGRIHY